MNCACQKETFRRTTASTARTGRLVDLHNLPKPRWRDALRALAAPAARVHAYRNLHSRALDAVIEDGCREKTDE